MPVNRLDQDNHGNWPEPVRLFGLEGPKASAGRWSRAGWQDRARGYTIDDNHEKGASA